MVELIKDASNSIFTKNPIRRVFSNPVTFSTNKPEDVVRLVYTGASYTAANYTAAHGLH